MKLIASRAVTSAEVARVIAAGASHEVFCRLPLRPTPPTLEESRGGNESSFSDTSWKVARDSIVTPRIRRELWATDAFAPCFDL
jgi:hypothetical protein